MDGNDSVSGAGSASKLTYDDFALFPDDGMRHELIDGEHYVTPSPNTRHQRILGRLYLLVASWLEDHPIGQAFLAPYDVVFSRFDVVEPDLIYLSNARAAEVRTELHAHSVPEVVVEILSQGTKKRDETIKRPLYERAGVSEYWLLDVEIDVVRIYKRQGSNGFGSAIELTREAGGILTTALLPGLEMPLATIFR